MKKFISLTKVILKNSTGTLLPSGSKRRSIGFLLLAAVYLPILALLTFVLLKGYNEIEKLGLRDALMTGCIATGCVAMTVLGVFYILSIYYFSDETVHLLTLPVKSSAILSAKFVVACLYLLAVGSLFILPCLIAFGIKSGSPAYIIYSAVVFVTMPVIPAAVCSILSIIIMAFGKFFRNKDAVKTIVSLLSGAILVAFVLLLQGFLNGSAQTKVIATSGGRLAQNISLIFPSSRFAAYPLLHQNLSSFINILLYLLISATFLIVFLVLGQGLYFRGVIGLSQSTPHKQTFARGGLYHGIRRRPPMLSYIKKELIVLIRTPAYFVNCVLGGVVIIPVVLIAVSVPMIKSGILGTSGISLPVNTVSVGAISAFLCVLSASNSLSATAISRDGKDFYLMRRLPIPLKRQVTAKLMPGLLASYLSLAVYLGIMCILRLNIRLVSLCGLVTIPSIATANFIGIFCEMWLPNIEWDDETVAIKHNPNSMFQFFVSAILCCAAIFVAFKLNFDMKSGIIFLFAVNTAIAVILGMLTFTKGTAFIEDMPCRKSDSNPAKKMNAIVTVVILAAVVVLIVTTLGVKTSIKIFGGSVNINAGLMESFSFRTADISKVYEKSSMPSCSRIAGDSINNQKRGLFNVAGMGTGHIYVQSKTEPFLYVKLKSGFVIINYDKPEETNSLYSKLKAVGKR